ncbi:hypothetical protein SEA_FUZZBUSTER_77 [Microbacterium phage FuzzBuster]|uniref:Uncharacterized protein n=1 Tax=Microbacterium phage FuzzBuster TaxID=2590935 RepID=A0A516KV51_9CAUD|nr:hypothetical protein SEA_FUZZBUSTER_77 [Microbacterium phage FuzzBuster]
MVDAETGVETEVEEDPNFLHLLTPEQIAAYESVQASLKAREHTPDDPDRQRERPFIWYYTTALYDAPSYHPDDWVKRWEVQSGWPDNTCGMDFDTFEDAMIGARLLAIREVLGWSLENRPGEGPLRMVLTCWCGWSCLIDGCYSDPIVPHVKSAHPDHPVVRG